MMNDEILHAVLSELSEADKELAINNGLLTKAVENLSTVVKEMENKTSNLKVSVPAPDTKPIMIELVKHCKRVEAIISQQPKQVLHEKRITFFQSEAISSIFIRRCLDSF